jgi:hypothetical protein
MKEKISQNKKFYFGLLIPLFDDSKDLGAYGYCGNNETKIIIIKTLEIDDYNLENRLSNIYSTYTNMIMNPFFNKKLLEDGNNNNIKEKFINDIINIIKN